MSDCDECAGELICKWTIMVVGRSEHGVLFVMGEVSSTKHSKYVQNQ